MVAASGLLARRDSFSKFQNTSERQLNGAPIPSSGMQAQFPEDELPNITVNREPRADICSSQKSLDAPVSLHVPFQCLEWPLR